MRDYHGDATANPGGAQGRDLHAEFIRPLPSPPRPIAIQRFSPRRIGLALVVLAGIFLAVGLIWSNLDGLGLTAG